MSTRLIELPRRATMRSARSLLAAALVLRIAETKLVLAADPEVEELKKQIRILQKRVEELERTRAATPAPSAGAVAAKPPLKEIVGQAAEVDDRGSMRDQQQAAPRVGALTLDRSTGASSTFRTPRR